MARPTGSNLWPLAPEASGHDSETPVNIDDSETAKKLTTSFTTQNEKLTTSEALLEALKALPREDLLTLLTDILKP